MGIARSLFATAALCGIASCSPQTPAQPLTETQISERHRIEREATLSDLRRHTRTTTGTPLRTVLVKVPESPNCVLDQNSNADDSGLVDRCQEEFTSLLGERIDALLLDRATNGTCTLRDVEVLHARIVWRGMAANGGPATLPSGALVFMECCGEPTPYPCSESRSHSTKTPQEGEIR